MERGDDGEGRGVIINDQSGEFAVARSTVTVFSMTVIDMGGGAFSHLTRIRNICGWSPALLEIQILIRALQTKAPTTTTK